MNKIKAQATLAEYTKVNKQIKKYAIYGSITARKMILN